MPARVKAGAAVARSHHYVWHFERLESKIMAPSLAYVRDAMGHGDVPSTLASFLFKRRVYMVTGVRVVAGARMQRERRAKASVGADAEASDPGQAVAAGARASASREQLDTEEFGKASDFVFAYRLNEVHYRGTVTHRPYTGGETSSADAPAAKRESEILIDGFEVLKISDVPFAGNSKDFDRVTVSEHQGMECFLSKDAPL